MCKSHQQLQLLQVIPQFAVSNAIWLEFLGDNQIHFITSTPSHTEAAWSLVLLVYSWFYKHVLYKWYLGPFDILTYS